MEDLQFYQLRNGTNIVVEGMECIVLDCQFEYHKDSSLDCVHARMLSVRSGTELERTFTHECIIPRGKLPKEPLRLNSKKAGCLVFSNVISGKVLCFSGELASGLLGFLVPGASADGVFWGDQLVAVNPPVTVELEVSNIVPQGGDYAVTAQAELETGLRVVVPCIIEKRDRIRIDTRNGSYVGRV